MLFGCQRFPPFSDLENQSDSYKPSPGTCRCQNTGLQTQSCSLWQYSCFSRYSCQLNCLWALSIGHFGVERLEDSKSMWSSHGARNQLRGWVKPVLHRTEGLPANRHKLHCGLLGSRCRWCPSICKCRSTDQKYGRSLYLFHTPSCHHTCRETKRSSRLFRWVKVIDSSMIPQTCLPALDVFQSVYLETLCICKLICRNAITAMYVST